MTPDDVLVPHCRHGADQAVGAATEAPQVPGGLNRIGRLVEPCALAFEDLVGADHQGPGMACRYRSGLRLGQGQGGGLDRFGTQAVLDRGFVDGGGVADMIDARVGQNLGAGAAGGGQDQGADSQVTDSRRRL